MGKILFIGGPGNLSENTVKLLLENPDDQIGIFTLPESLSKGLSGRVSFFRGNRDNEIELAQVIETFQLRSELSNFIKKENMNK